MASLVQSTDVPAVVLLPTTTVGAANELIAAADLMRRGYHVFRALSPSCPSDLVAYRVGHPFRVQVRTARADSATRILSFPLKDKDKGTFDVLALVVEGDAVYYLPQLQSGTRLPYLIAKENADRLRQWGIIRGAAVYQHSDAMHQAMS